MRGVQGCEVLGFLLGLFGVIIAAIWVCKPDVQALKWITFIFFLIAGKASFHTLKISSEQLLMISK